MEYRVLSTAAHPRSLVLNQHTYVVPMRRNGTELSDLPSQLAFASASSSSVQPGSPQCVLYAIFHLVGISSVVYDGPPCEGKVASRNP